MPTAISIGGVSCSADSLVVAESFVLRKNNSGKKTAPAERCVSLRSGNQGLRPAMSAFHRCVNAYPVRVVLSVVSTCKTGHRPYLTNRRKYATLAITVWIWINSFLQTITVIQSTNPPIR